MSRRDETGERDAQKRRFVRQLLNSYFQFRSPLPGDGYIQENKTTLQIQDELEPMMHVSGLDIVEYMDDHDYSFITEQDGTVSWAVWRQV
ncbi:MAG: hypothetical protein IJR87_08670 [Bacteroidaceae bacterium]|nr:hypothetical protein [Bacteroidaceae bacterium]